MLQRFLDPSTLASISGLDLVARPWSMASSRGFTAPRISGFPRSSPNIALIPRATTSGTWIGTCSPAPKRCFLKRYRGETNTQLLVLLDTSASMAYGSHAVTKLDYARFVAASLCYMAQCAARCRGADRVR